MLDFRQGTGLVSVDAPPSQVYEQVLLEAAHKKLKVNSIFFYRPANGGTSVPYIYFRRLEGQDLAQVSADIAELHKLAWNMGQAPLLIVTLPSGQVLIYNNYVPPSEYEPGTTYQTGLIKSLNIFAEAEKSRRSLRAYHRNEFESGRFWSANKARFDLTKRADYTLLENLKVMRRELLQLLPESVEPAVASSIVHSLLGRSIFIKYLEDRADANDNNVFPEGFFEQFLSDASDFVGVLKQREATYALFNYLEAKFNGDIFPVSEEEKQYIDETHLDWLSSFLQGEERLATGQLGLWKFYSFDVIPIEFISSIYEEFFHIQQTAQGDDADDNGTHYTPHHLVEFLVDEVFPWDSTNTECKVLDPACGSGIFLVEVYRRLIERWRRANSGKLLDFAALEQLLTRSHLINSSGAE